MAFEKLKNNLNNKENLLKIFDRESYDYFINEIILINKLKEVLNYYSQFLFESKKRF